MEVINSQPNENFYKTKEKVENPNTPLSFFVKPTQSFTIMSDVIESNIEYIDKNSVVFVSGSNLVCYDMHNKTSRFLLRKCPNFTITSMSVGYKNSGTKEKKQTSEAFVCLGEYNQYTKTCQISTISIKNPQVQYILQWKTTDKNLSEDWKIFQCKILKNSAYCVGIGKRETHNYIQSKISFWRFTQEKFISDVVIHENINHCSYNPQNSLELVLCGNGYLRLWNVFINEGSIKEHPQRFLRGKQEKEHNFISAQFFESKSFTFIVGTTRNIFYILEGFQIIYEFDASYETQNIHEMNLERLSKTKEQEDEEEKYFTEQNTKTEEDEEKSLTTNSLRNTKKNYLSLKEEKVNYDNNSIRTFHLINDSLILLGFQKSSVFYIYKLEKDFKNKKERDALMITETEENKNRSEEQSVLRIAKNVKSIINIVGNQDRSQFIFMLEIYNDEKLMPKSSKTIDSKLKSLNSMNTFNLVPSPDTTICLYLFFRKEAKLHFIREVFKEYFYFNSVKTLDFNEKKQIIYTITNNSMLRCFNYNTGSFLIKYSFGLNDPPTGITVCSHNNLFAITFTKRLVLFALFRDSIKIFCEFEILDAHAKFTTKGDYLVVAGQSKSAKNSFCIYFIDTLYFNTLFVIDKLPKIKKICFLENDNYVFALTESSVIFGWSIRLDLMSVGIMSRFRELDSSVDQYFSKPIFKHRGVEYIDFDYDPKNDMLVVIAQNTPKISVYTKSGKVNLCNIEISKNPKIIKIIRDLKCVIVGLEDGSLRIYRWPIEISEINNLNNQNIALGLSEKNILFEVNLHTKELNNLLISDNFKNIITSSTDGSLIFSNLLQIREGKVSEFSHFSESIAKLRPAFEEIVKIGDLVEFRVADIRNKDKKVEALDEEIRLKLQQNFDSKESKIREHRLEIKSLDYQKGDALGEEDKKERQLRLELENLNHNIQIESKNRLLDHDKEKERISNKHNEKLSTYQSAIEQLRQDLRELVEEIEDKFKGINSNQNEYFQTLYDFYHKQYSEIKIKIDQCLSKLAKDCAVYDEAVYTITEHYTNILNDIGKRIEETTLKNTVDINLLQKVQEEEKRKEAEYKYGLDQKVQESDKIIQKNAEIKKQIIDTTQRTITFQEQLLETDKNLQKIAKKIKDLDLKNKHLEQIRFVLEHRMTSLDKEKAPLEGQCLLLEKQKNNLQDEFNKLILQINLKNQLLENKQSQLRASLIQNFEINDQISYIQKKLKHLHSEIKSFIVSYKDAESENLSLKENKATFVALKLRQFYDKYFSNTIDDELQNYKFFAAKLQEETEKMNIANNFNLIMRDKAEEKLISEKEKFEQIKIHKERGFKRMQNENTVLIAECNRLRKNLHEVYMHVVDIESKFENLTKINPTLNKIDIVYQIKEFIKQTHNKIKSNFKDDNNNSNNMSLNKSDVYGTNLNTNSNNIISESNNAQKEEPYINEGLINEIIYPDNIINVEILREKLSNDNSDMEDYDRQAYENFLKLPDIKSHSNSFKESIPSRTHSQIFSHAKLPVIDEPTKTK